MAKISKRYYRRNRYRRFKSMISRYHATKLTYVDNIRLATNELKFVKQDAARARIGDIVALCPDFTAYKALFLSYKVTGIKITVTPQYPLANFDMRHGVVLGITAASDDETASNVAESNKSLILSPIQMVSKYFSLQGGIIGWQPTTPAGQTVAGGYITVASDGYANGGGIIFSVVFDFYVMFKNAA